MIVAGLYLILLVGLLLAGWWLDDWLAGHALAELQQGQWVRLSGTDGWALATQLWPIALPLALIALAVGGLLGLQLSRLAYRAYVGRLARETREAEQARFTADQRAREQAQAELASKREHVAAEQARWRHYQAQAEQARQQAEADQRAAQQSVAEAQQAAEIAQHKKTRAKAFNERREKRLDRLRRRLQAGESVPSEEILVMLR